MNHHPVASKMRALSALPVDDDIVYRLLSTLSDFQSVQSMISTCKAINYVFKAHSNSIIRAIATNIAGPALPQAIQLAQCQARDEDTVSLISDESESDQITVNIKAPEGRFLVDNAKVVNELEDLFSMRNKNRASKTSLLTHDESWRFQRAIYRIWLFSETFGIKQDVQYTIFTQAQAHEPEMQKQFLDVFASQDLLDIQRVSSFLTGVSDWTQTSQGNLNPLDSARDIALAYGPKWILSAFKSEIVPSNPVFGVVGDGFISNPLSCILRERKIDPPEPRDYNKKKIILDQVDGEGDKCQHCENVQGLELWNECNWEYLKGVIPLQILVSLPKGRLRYNARESQQISAYFWDQSFSYPGFMREIMDVKTAVYTAWETDHWICADCLQEFIRCHLHLWLLERNRKAGETIAEDCWYGYNCRTMVHNFSHATRLNHLCEPTRGDMN